MTARDAALKVSIPVKNEYPEADQDVKKYGGSKRPEEVMRVFDKQV